MHVSEIFSVEDLQTEIDAGYITARPHAVEPLTIYNYSAAAQFEQRWSDIVRACRGLILDDDYNVVARPPDKFFNLGDNAITNAIEFDESVEIMDKLDGSLGILYRKPSDGTFAVATRGSFHSEQAEHATALWEDRYSDYYLHHEFTAYFEIIYPENRIVLNYGDTDDLVLLGARHKQRGYLLGPEEATAIICRLDSDGIPYEPWMGEVADVFTFNTISEALRNTGRNNAEGFVIRRGSTLVKIKEPAYLDIHRIRFDMTPRRIWEVMSSGGNIDELLAQLPDEFHADLTSVRDGLEEEYAALDADIRREYDRIKDIPERKNFAKAAVRSRNKAALFALHDGKSIDEYIWKELKI